MAEYSPSADTRILEGIFATFLEYSSQHISSLCSAVAPRPGRRTMKVLVIAVDGHSAFRCGLD